MKVSATGNDSQIYTSTGGLTDTWQTALYTFVATSSSTTLTVGINGQNGKILPDGAWIAVDSLNLTQTSSTINEAAAQPISFIGTSSADNAPFGTDGNDTFTANGGADRIFAGAGNDTVVINADNITQLSASNTMLLDGGTGINTLRIDTNAASTNTLDLTNTTVGNKVRGFNTIDLTGNGNNTLKLDYAAVVRTSTVVDDGKTLADESRMMVVNGNSGDALQLVGSWTAGSAVSGASLAATYGSAYGFASGTNYTAYTLQGATVFVASAVGVTNNASPSAGAAGNVTTGATVESLFGTNAGVFSDVDSGQTFKGVAVVGNASGYQYSTNGGSNWTNMPAVSDASALYLSGSTLIRYSGSGTPPELTVRLVDTSGQTGTASVASGDTVNASTNGGSTAFSGSTVKLVPDLTAPLTPEAYVHANANKDGYVNAAEMNNYGWSSLRIRATNVGLLRGLPSWVRSA